MSDSSTLALKRALPTLNLTLFGLVAIAPIAGITLYGFVSTAAEGAVLPAYITAALCVCLTALSFAAMADVAPGAGSVYGYTAKAFGYRLGFFGAWAMLLDYLLLNALTIVFGALYLTSALPWLPLGPTVAGFVLVAAGMAFLGIRWSARADVAQTVLQGAAVLVVVLWAAALLVGPSETEFVPTAFWPQGVPLNAMIAGATIAIIAYLGFDAISTLAEEVKHEAPGRAIGIATISAVLLMTAVFLATGWALGGMTGDLENLDPATAGFQIIDARLPVLSVPLGIITGFALGLGVNLACMTGASRVLFALGRDRHLPSALARVHPGFGSPWVATLAVFVVVGSVSLVALEQADLLANLVSLGALTGFLLVNLSVIGHFGLRHRSTKLLRHWLLPAAGAVVVLFILFSISANALQLGAVWFAVGIGIALVRRGRVPQD